MPSLPPPLCVAARTRARTQCDQRRCRRVRGQRRRERRRSTASSGDGDVHEGGGADAMEPPRVPTSWLCRDVPVLLAAGFRRWLLECRSQLHGQ
jgi:hypothetical protein